MTKRYKKKEPPTTSKLPNDLDLAYWSRYSAYRCLNTGQILSKENYTINFKRSAAAVASYRQVCAICRTDVVDGVFSCTCVMHNNCRSSFTNATDLILGRCKSQEHCNRCCTCIICTRCKRNITHEVKKHTKMLLGPSVINNKFDTSCNKCIKCCTCKRCVNCKNTIKNSCACSIDQRPHHPDCCDSDSRIEQLGRKLLFIKREPVFHEGANFQQNRVRRFLSIESEFDHFNSPTDAQMIGFNKWARKWSHSIVLDGTVPQGGEICTAPASGEAFSECISGLAAHHKALGSQISVRCGMHVHVDARDFRYAELTNLLYLYNKLEPALFAMLPPWRRINRFTNPCRSLMLTLAKNGSKLIEQVQDFEMSYLKGDIVNAKHIKKPSMALMMAERLYGQKSMMRAKRVHKSTDNQRARYMALNLHSWVYRRTIEFRHWPGTIDEQEMLLWPQICGAILEYAKRTPIIIKSKMKWKPTISKLPSDPCEALFEVLRPRTWVSSELSKFAEQTIQHWSPDWSSVWPLLPKEDNRVVPLRASDREGLFLSFDIPRMLYTYISPLYQTWQFQWGSPETAHGRYATTQDLTAPANGTIKYLAPLPLPVVQPAPTTYSMQTTTTPISI